MDPTFGLITVVGGGILALGWLATAITQRTRAEWTCVWQGRSIRLAASQNKKTLFVNGERVAEKTTLSGSGATLTWELVQDAGPPIVISATIAYPRGRSAAFGAIYVDGVWVGGSRWSAPAAPAASGSATLCAGSTDPRWPAATVLLAGLRAGARAELTEAAQRVEAGLADAFNKLQQLDKAREAHKALGGEDAVLDAAKARLEAHIGELLDALRELHVLAVAGAAPPSLDRLDELVARVAAEDEVDRATSRARLREAAGQAPNR